MKHKSTTFISIILVIVACITIAVTFVDYEKTINKQKQHIKLLQEELNDSKDAMKYYQKQYKKYYELSEELENQIGVYSN